MEPVVLWNTESASTQGRQMENLVRALKNHETPEFLMQTFEYKKFTVFEYAASFCR